MARKMELHKLIKGTTTSYSRYTIRNRAIPKVSDGLKPIHRKIIFSMYKDKLFYDKYRLKSNTVAGSVLKYSAHGDSSVYEAMVRLANDSVVYQLIDGKGAFSSITTSDVQAGSSRYTESRLSHVSNEFLDGLDKNAVDFVLNYDETREEPVSLPSSVPMILMNPNKGIASGIATNIPSFDLKDLRDNVGALLSNQEMKLMYPNFATGGYVLRDESVAKSVETSGSGGFILRAKYHIEGDDIIVTELPYGSTVESISDKIYLMKHQKDQDVSDIVYINDDTGVSGFQFRIETKKGTDKENLMKILYKRTALEAKFSCNMYVLNNLNNPKLWGTRDILLEWIKFRAETIKRIAHYDMDKKKKDLNILYGLKQATDELDDIIKLIRSCEDGEVIEKIIVRGYNLEQAEYIVSRNLRQLNKTYISSKIKRIKEIEKEVKKLEKFVKSKRMIADKILEDIDNAISLHYVDRKTEILDEFDTEINRSKIEEANDYNIKVIVTNDGYIKKLPLTSLRGNFTIKFKDGDFAVQEIETVNSEELLIFTNKRNVYKKFFSELKDTKPSELGTFLINEIDSASDEEIIGIVPLSESVKSILIGYEDGKIALIDEKSYRTKQNRSVLKNAFCDKVAILFRGLTDDIDVMSVSSDTKTVLMSTDKINPKSSKTTQGTTFQKIKDGERIERYILNIDEIENPEYYRVANAGVGKFFK